MANANLHSNSSIFNNKGYKETQTMNDTDKILDEILIKYAEDNFLQTSQVQAHIDAKEAIKQLIEEQVTESYKKGYIDRGIRIN